MNSVFGLFIGRIWWARVRNKEIEGPSKLDGKFEYAKFG